MSITRAPRPVSGFYTLDKRISEDRRLSWAARGVLIYLLGKPDNWRTTVPDLIRQTEMIDRKTGRDGVYAILAELIEVGYMRRYQVAGEGGVFGSYDYVVREHADHAPLPAQPDTADPTPHTAQPDTAQPLTAEPDHSKEGSLAKTERSNSYPGARRLGEEGYTVAFEQFWKTYPAKTKGSKWNAFAQWKKMLIEKDGHAQRLMDDCALRGSTHRPWREGYIPHAERYLKHRLWQDEIDRSPPRGSNLGKRADVEEHNRNVADDWANGKHH